MTVPAECKDKGMFFIQYGCELDTQKRERQVFGLYFACTAVFIYFYSTVFIDYIKSVESTNQLDFDVKTLTAGDYSAEFSIAHTQYDAWKEKYFQEANPMSEMAQFKLYVQLEIEKRLTEMPNLGIDPDIHEIKIAQITFAYNNSKVINWLKKRGGFIQKQKWDALDNLEKEIFGQLQEKDAEGNLTKAAEDLLDQLQTPCTCVITFESEEGLARA